MKNNLLKNVLVAALFCSSGNYLSATDLYLSSAGNDTNNGLSAETPVKTLSRAFTLAENGDEIHVLDFIDISAEPKKEGSTSNNDIKVDGSTSFELGGITYATWNVQGKNGVRPLDKSLKIIGKSAETCGFVGNGMTRLIRIDSFNQSIEFANLSFREGNSIRIFGMHRHLLPIVFLTVTLLTEEVVRLFMLCWNKIGLVCLLPVAHFPIIRRVKGTEL